jgi:hypothetical protein
MDNEVELLKKLEDISKSLKDIHGELKESNEISKVALQSFNDERRKEMERWHVLGILINKMYLETRRTNETLMAEEDKKGDESGVHISK